MPASSATSIILAPASCWPAADRVTNQSGGAIIGNRGVNAGAAATVVNAGNIAGKITTRSGAGIVLGAGGFGHQPGHRRHHRILRHYRQFSGDHRGERRGRSAAAATSGFGIRAGAGGRCHQSGERHDHRPSMPFAWWPSRPTVVNAGHIVGLASAGGHGIVLAAGGYISNQSGAPSPAPPGPSSAVWRADADQCGQYRWQHDLRFRSRHPERRKPSPTQAGGTISGHNGLAAYAAASVVNAGRHRRPPRFRALAFTSRPAVP